MATTQAQRAALFNTLTELMGQDDAETLTEQLPPGGWDTMATKDDIKVLGATLTAAMAAGFAHATEERAKLTTAIAEVNTTMAAGFAHATEERAKLIASQARHLYVTVATIMLATASIWIALFVAPAA